MLLLLAFIGGLCLTATATAEPYQPVYHPAMTVTKAAGPIAIDGNLDDAGWQDAGRAGNFAEHFPGDQTQPAVNTTALMTYDDRCMYVAFICNDNPRDIRASFSERDKMFGDDDIVLALDTYGDAAWAYEFVVNPYGIQGDLLWSRTGDEDERYDFIWASAGKITDSGYQVEMAIPFTSLRFPQKEVQTWRVDFWRNRPRASREQYSWAAYDRNESCWPCQWGTVTGLTGIKPGRGWEILPAFVGYQQGKLTDESASRHFENADPDGEFSLGLKYRLASNLTAEATINPDFSQVESDAAQIDVNTTSALFYSERRPFFQEGSDLFNSQTNAVYTRSINNPQIAAKIIGRLNRTSIAFLTARDERSPIILPFEESSEFVLAGKSVGSIARLRQTFGEESFIGMLATDRRFDGGGSGTIAGIDGGFRLSKNFRFEWQAIKSFTEEPDDTALTSDLTGLRFDGRSRTAAFDGESFSGHVLLGLLEREGRHWSSSLSYEETSPTYRADLGFEPINNRREVECSNEYVFFVESPILDRIYVESDVARVWNFDGHRKDEWISIDLGGQFKGQTTAFVNTMRSRETFHGIYFPGIRRTSVSIESNFSNPLSLGFYLSNGHTITRREEPPVMGKETYLEFWATIKPFDRLRIEPSLEYDRSVSLANGKTLFNGYITRWRVSYQFLPTLSVRLIAQYDDFDRVWQLDPLLSYRLNPLSVFYLGSTYNYEDLDATPGNRTEWGLAERQFFLKIQYLFQL